jgi:DNA uptake protein ComE-like DNA-binding protein
MKTRSNLALLAAVVLAALCLAGSAVAADPKTASAQTVTSAPVDLNSATEKQLESLPGVGPATAKKIVAGRPYAAVADLAKAGVSAKTIEKITPLVTVGAAAAPAAQAAAAPVAAAAATTSQHATTKTKTAAGAPVDLNSATEKQLESLPGVGPATAKKIVAGRPYAAVADLTKAGVSAKTIEKITPLVVVGAAAAPAVAVPARAATAAAPAVTQASAAPATETVAQMPPVKGMVWVNLESKVFHREGDKWYGTTKKGKFMTEQDALAAGYREAKPSGAKPAQPK